MAIDGFRKNQVEQTLQPRFWKKRWRPSTKVNALKACKIMRFRCNSQAQLIDQCRFHRLHRVVICREMKVAVVTRSSTEWNVNVNPKHAPKFAPKSC